MASVNTNYGALVALQSLNQTGRELSEVQQRINTGLKVSSAKDNGADLEPLIYIHRSMMEGLSAT